ncbi:hypothetical protein DOTSEDRAFT_69768 [Dothistroma septosporum NZE10]|uniref:Uncharacterized protein n=1 Tax=Dothistroma septosporum (strain NZE10 / CBS 128990) TaxID=675120 RepID=N1PX01_DOTSN|nr:hypothetical protein DOTSEDRAFT_69768 [Dothistroma septosporum NZE10]
MDFTSKDILVRGMHVTQLFLAVYGASVSYVAVTKLQQYEETSKKLAEWSNTAANELHKTRTTQTSGALAIIASILASGTLAFFPSALPSWARMGAYSSLSKRYRLLTIIGLSPALLVGVLFARGHIKKYWTPRDGKNVTRIPLPKMGEYNVALQQTEVLLQILEFLEYSWVATAFINGMIG